MYLCWNSFKSSWFWGPKRLSEKLNPSKFLFNEPGDKIKPLLEKWGGKQVWAEDDSAYILIKRD